MNDPIVIVSAARTAMGSFQGGFASLTAANLGAVAIKAAVERAGIDANLIDEVLMGCVLQAGQGQAPARQAALQAGLPLSAGCATIHKVCGSGRPSICPKVCLLTVKVSPVVSMRPITSSTAATLAETGSGA